ncbi:MAG TPA: serine hydrolase domain-containing protein [Polyangiaceae bacterium]|nr:serine hydrolase domain-containing protein [Polyangiaceae bacterium]
MESLRAIVTPALEPCPTTGMVIGVIARRRRRVYGFAPRSTPESGPHGATIYEIGSITKVFTTSLLASLLAERRLHLEDAVRDRLPELSRLPPEITLRRLATHTSGLPRWPADASFMLSMGKNPRDPLSGYTSDDLLRWLASYTAAPQSDREVTYSNVGMALLGDVCARAAGAPYEDAVQERIGRILGLRDTSVRVREAQRAQVAPPHHWRGDVSAAWSLPAFAGAGALRSTADDLLRFLEANLDPEHHLPALGLCHDVQIADPRFAVTELPRELARAYGLEIDPSTVAASNPRLRPGRFRVALGWMRTIDEDGRDVHWHNGATGGYRSFVGFSKRERIAVAVLCNRGVTFGDTVVDDIGFGVLRLLATALPEPDAPN